MTIANTTNTVLPLPPGVHPTDPRYPAAPIIPPAQVGPVAETTRPPFDIPNGKAMGVFQRASSDWSARTLTLSSTETVIQAAGRLKGRESVTLFVPSTATNGVVVARTQGTAQLHGGVPIAVDGSITIRTEAPVYVGLLSGKTTGKVCVVETFNPDGGR